MFKETGGEQEVIKQKTTDSCFKMEEKFNCVK